MSIENFLFQFNIKKLCLHLGIVADKNLRDLDDIPNIIMLVLECVRDVALHFRLIETLMLFKENLWIVSTLAVMKFLQIGYICGTVVA